MTAALIAAAIIVATGLHLTRAGAPYKGVPVAVHKLGVLALLVTAGLAACDGGFGWAAGTGAILAVAAIATGALAVARGRPARALRVAHRVGGWLALVVAVAVPARLF